MHIRPSSILLLAALMIFAFACNRRDSKEWHVGALYSIANGDGRFGVVKVLVLEPEAVHVRIYKQKFDTRPTIVDPQSLTLGGVNDKGGTGIGHLPLSRATFASWQPFFLSQQTVSDEELDGYKMWMSGSDKTF